MDLRRILLCVIVVAAGALPLPVSAVRAQTASENDAIKNSIVERLEQLKRDLSQVAGQERTVLAALETADHLTYRSVLERLRRGGNGYADWAFKLVNQQPALLAASLDATNYRTKFLRECLPEGVADRVAKSKDIVDTAIKNIKKSLPENVPAHLSKMLKDLKEPEGRPPRTVAACLDPMAGGSGLVGPSDESLNVKWVSPCYPSERPDQQGTSDLTSPTVASILYDNGITGPAAFCTGTLIAPNIVLTAAHCFCHMAAKQPGGPFLSTADVCRRGGFFRSGSWQEALNPRHHSVFFQHAGVFSISRVILHREFNWAGGLSHADVALLVLDRPVRDFAPTPINRIARLRPGTSGTAAGYGYFRPINRDGVPASTVQIQRETGLKLRGQVITDACSPFAARRKLICWTHRLQGRGLSLGSTCSGDSGGPLFADHQGQTYLVGVTSAGDASCGPGSRAYDTEVFQFREWIAENLKRYAGVAAVPPVSGAKQNKCMLCTFCDSDLNQPSTSNPSTDADRVGEIRISSPNVRRLRVSVNCTPGMTRAPIGIGLNLSGSQIQACARETEPGSVSSCETPARAGQTWKVKVDGISQRQCQIVATTFEN